ncbi:MAG: hypothetical protein Q4Q58_02405 [Thermoplasmata archaeon]|nr:hypothetical protein [Thermoplasmata archaeon]
MVDATTLAAEAAASQWDLYSAYFDSGIPYGAIISSVFIVALCAYATWKARKLYKEL